MAYRAVLGLLVLATPVQGQLSQAWPNHALQRSPLCETIHNELLCARAIEAVQLPLSQGWSADTGTHSRFVSTRPDFLQFSEVLELSWNDSSWALDAAGADPAE